MSRIRSALAGRDLPEPQFFSSSVADSFTVSIALPDKADSLSGGSESLSGGSEAQPRGSGKQPGGSEPLSKGSELLSEGSEPLSKGSEPLSKGLDSLFEGFQLPPGSPTPEGAFSILNDLSDEVRRRLNDLGPRAERDEVQALILAMCRARPHQPRELASLLGRGRNYLLANYLTPMVEAGLLHRLYPLGDPRQAYVADPAQEGEEQ